MTTNNIQTKSKSAVDNRSAVIFMDKYSTAELTDIRAMCTANNLDISCIMYNYMLHEVKPYKEIIKYIRDQEHPPAVIIDSNTCLYPQCIVSSSVLGTLEEMKLAEIYTYDQQLKTDENSIESQESEESQQKHPKLHLIKQPTFDLLTNATWQLKAVEAMCEEKQKQDKTKRGE